MAGHESFDRPDDVKMGSERSFGIVFAVVFALIGCWQLWHGRPSTLWWLTGALAFLLVAFIAPAILAPLNRIWFKFGLLLHRIMNPVILGLLFFGVVLPTGLLMRVLGKRPLGLGYDKTATSYWVRRSPPGPQPESFTKQF